MIAQEYIKTLDCGIRGCDYVKALCEYPGLYEVFDRFPDNLDNFCFDIKVHMLMPGQFPCIPNWHRDFVPRDINNKPQLDKIKTEFPLYLWLSGHPLTEFKDGREILPQTWVKFTQNDLHRGAVSDSHTWRLFIRASHKEITPKHNIALGKVRHSQVYLDSEKFVW